MVGKIHKKKISEYTEAAENEDRQSDKGDDGEEEILDNIEAIASGSESENGDIAHNENKSADSVIANDEDAGIEDDEVEETGHNDEDFKAELALDEEDDLDFEENDVKKAKKRKATTKKFGDGEDEDEPLNGTPKKKGRKAGSVKTKAKVTKPKAKKAAVAIDDDDEVEGEEEYEVKDIVGHKMERGVSYFLIRWKGYTKADDTWEAEDTLNCPDIIDRYKKKQVISSPKKKGTPAKKAKKPAGKPKKEETQQEWEVEKIIDYAEEKKGRVFRIRWKGFGPKNDTWEPEANLNCQDIIQKFLSKMKLQENVSFKELREEPKKPKRLFNETAPRTNINNPIGRKSKRAVTKKSDDEDVDAGEVEHTHSAPIKKSLNEFERLCKSISETVSKINTSIDEPLEDNVDLQFLKMMMSLMKDIPSIAKNKFQSDMFAEIYKLRVQCSNLKEFDRNRGNTKTAPIAVAAVAPQSSPKPSNTKPKSKTRSKRKRWL